MAVRVADFDHLPEAVRIEFLELREHFLMGLSKRWEDIEFASNTAEQSASLHRLVGAASCYGYERLSEIAREIYVCSTRGNNSPVMGLLLELRKEIEGLSV
jgi:hypothetical protein